MTHWEKGLPIIPDAPFSSCPIAASLGIFGKKWTLLVLRDMAMRKIERFSGLVDSIEGITPRVLSMRLKELESSGIIKRVENSKAPKFVRWNLTEKGWDALPILMSYVAFGSKWLAPSVFVDSKAREMKTIYPQRELKNLYVNVEVDLKSIRRLQQEQQQKNSNSLNSWAK